MNTPHRKASPVRPLAALGCLLAAALPAGAAPLVEETFSDGNRTADPVWYWVNSIASANRVDSVAANAWTVGTATTSGGGYVVTHFTPTTLGLGESITLSFAFQYVTASTSASNQFRFGLFDSGGSRISADVFSSTAASGFNADRGYGTFYTLQTNTSPAAFSIKSRTGNNDTLWSTTALATTLGVNESSAVSAAGTTYGASLTISRSAVDALTISSTINGQTIERTDTSPSTFTFDMVSIYAGGANGALTLSNINVVSAVPEPSSYALLAGFIGLGSALSRRRR